MPRPISYAVFCLKKKNDGARDMAIFGQGSAVGNNPDYLQDVFSNEFASDSDISTLSLHDALPISSYDADNRPLLVMRSNLWASGYDVDGTDQTSLGQFSGRVQQTYKHSVPRFFVPEHGTMFTLALVRFPPTATKEIQYLN